MPELVLIEELGDYLVAQGVARAGNGPVGALPPVWLAPIDGVPQPDGDDTAAVTLSPNTVIPGEWLEGFLEERAIDVYVRADDSRIGELLQRQVRRLLDERKEIFVGALRLEWSKHFSGPHPIRLAAGSSDVAGDSSAPASRTYDTVQTFRMAARVKSLAGQPYAP